MSIEEEELGDDVADMIACSTDENLLRTPSSNATPTCSETLQRFNECCSASEFTRFIEALSNLTLPRCHINFSARMRQIQFQNPTPLLALRVSILVAQF